MIKVAKVKKKLIRLIVSALILTALLSSCIGVNADSFYSYIYNPDDEVVRAPAAVSVSATFTAGFNSPSDLIVTENGDIYVADRGNNRIAVVDSSGNIKEEINSFVRDGVSESFNAPTGVFVAQNGDLYICDTSNGRIIQLSSSREFIKQITLEKGETLPSDFVFSPTKVGVDGSGRIFVVSAGFNNGLLEFTEDGVFVRYMGASKVTLTPMQLFWRMFSTKEQRQKTSSNVSTEYNNIEVDSEGFLMVTSSAFTYYEYQSGAAQPLRRLNSKGTDVLSRIGNPSGDLYYPDAKFSTATYKGPSTLVDVCTLPYGSYAVLDQNRGRVFAYNSDGEMLYEFAGPGDISGSMTTPTALDYHDGNYYVVDSAKNNINVYTLTHYGSLFNSVAAARQSLDYEGEEALWREIVSENTNCELAMRGLGTAAYRKQDMKTAMRYFKEADDKESYSKAYVFVRRQWIEDNAIWLILTVAAIVVAIMLIKKLWLNLTVKKGKHSYFGRLQFANYVLFHPINGYWELKRENRGSVSVALTFLLLTCVTKVAGSAATGFLFSSTDTASYNLMSDVLLIVILVMIWVISQWCVTVLMNGEGNFKNIFVATCYSLVPYIWLNSIAIIISHFLSLDESELFGVLITIGLVYTVFLLVMSVMSTHNYSMGKTVLVIVIVLIVILLIAFIALLLITFIGQMISFVKDLYNEITLRI